MTGRSPRMQYNSHPEIRISSHPAGPAIPVRLPSRIHKIQGFVPCRTASSWSSSSPSSSPPAPRAPKSPPPVRAAEDLHTVRNGALTAGPAITGSVQPERRADLRAEVSAVVLQVLKEN